MKYIETEIVVIGSGPGGYAAAFYAADHGKKVILVEKDLELGGVCLNRGCIPSKALLHAAHLLNEVRHSKEMGISFGEAKIDLDKLRSWKDSILRKLSQGVRSMGKMRGVEVMHGRGYLEDSRTLRVETTEGQKFVRFQKAILAVGSEPAMPKAFDLGNKRIMTSTEALELEDVPARLLIVGGGYIGMELGTVYAALGSKIVLVEALPNILAGADPDLVRPVMKFALAHFEEVRLSSKVLKMETYLKQIKVISETAGQKREELYDRVLVSVGRKPNCDELGLKNTKVALDEKGFVKVDVHQQTSDPAILAIGDVAGGVMLAHKAVKEARVAVEYLCGEATAFEDIVMPAVVFTQPEVAWCGLTEAEAKAKGIEVKVARFPWAALGRALTINKPDGLTKLILDPDTERVLGVGIVGSGAGDIISEGVLAVEMGATAKDIAESIHPHPTLSETLMETAEVFYGISANSMSGRKIERQPQT
ncbi:MAG: dihydrolipoyl dehydrogenase [Omnitrophica bacterium GWA2_52_8]|nr:MAG: dihydrolipoyl dehydrogenase [Omnitrophica bacterium GWA2_52_8]